MSSIQLLQPVRGELTYDGIVSQKFADPYTSKDLLALYNSMGLVSHNGWDFYKGRGEPIYAAHDGYVVYAQEFASISGKSIKLWDKEGGYFTIYCHNDELLVSQGQSVSRGQIIAKMGNSGSQYTYMGVHLHFGLYMCDTQGITLNTDNGFKGAVDPLPYFDKKDMKIIGDKRDKRQYAVGEDNVLHWIFGQPGQDSASLQEFHNAGILDKNQVEWHDDLTGYTVGSPWGVLK